MPKDAYEKWLKHTRARLAAAAQQARPLVDQQRFAEAEALLRAVDNDIYGIVALGELYTNALSDLLAAGQLDALRPHAEKLFERALHWRQSATPEPHTPEEADRNSRIQSEALTSLVALLGYNPAHGRP